MAGYDLYGITVADNIAFTVLSADSIERFAGLGTRLKVPKNTVIYRAGDPCEYCYLILDGRVKAHEVTYDGADNIYNYCSSGTLIMELSAILGQKLPLEFTTITPCILVKISRTELLRAVTAGGEMTLDMFMSICSKFTAIMEQLRESSSHCVEWKLSNLLLNYADRFGSHYDGKVLIEEKLSQQMLANILRVNRMTVAKALGNLKDLGLVEHINGYWCIRSTDQLRRHMDYLDTIAEK